MVENTVQVSINTDILVDAMLNVLNKEGYINNRLYLAAREELKEEDKNVVKEL